jgi:hypothetical protein
MHLLVFVENAMESHLCSSEWDFVEVAKSLVPRDVFVEDPDERSTIQKTHSTARIVVTPRNLVC